MTIHHQLAARSSLPASAGLRTALPPGFRFHPTDEELILHYLRRRAASSPCPALIIAEVDIYKMDPWELPAKAVFGQPADGNNEWYFFSPRERKYPNGVRPNRAAGSGYWKATGTDKPITAGAGGEMIGVKKALVFYQGRPPKGMKTSWIMHEYRLAAAAGNTYRPPTMRSSFKDASMRLDDWVLCRIYKKPDQQLMYEPSSSMDVVGLAGAIAQHHQQQDQDVVATYDGEPSRSRMPRLPSISDYLEDYYAVSELFESMPPEAETQSSGADRFLSVTSGATGDEASTPTRKRQLSTAEDVSNNSNVDTSSAETLHASKRWLSDASTTMPTMNSTFSMFGPSHSRQDRI